MGRQEKKEQAGRTGQTGRAGQTGRTTHQFVWDGTGSCTCGWVSPYVRTEAPRVKLRKRLRDRLGGSPQGAPLLALLSRGLSFRTLRQREALIEWGAHVAVGKTESTKEGAWDS